MSEAHLREGLAFFVERVLRDGGGKIIKVFLFGSHAKGLANESSDVDILIVHGGDDGEVVGKVAEAAFDTMLKYHIPIEPVTMSIHECMGDNPFLNEVERDGKILFSIDPQGERGVLTRDYYALALEWLKYAREAIERGDTRLATDAGYNAAELIVKALIIGKAETLAKSHGGILDQFGRLYILPGEVDRDLGRELHQALILRNKARYDPRATLTKDDAIRITATAEKMITLFETRL